MHFKNACTPTFASLKVKSSMDGAPIAILESTDAGVSYNAGGGVDIRVAATGRRRQPRVIPWAQACANQAIEPDSAVRHRRVFRIGVKGFWNIEASRSIAFAESVADDLARRGILCDATARCNVSMAKDRLRICLPPSALESKLCEPWGERCMRGYSENGFLGAVLVILDVLP
jgi:hypothetical protein